MRWLDGITNSVDMSLSKLCLGDSEGQGILVRCSQWGREEWDMTYQLNNNLIAKYMGFCLKYL